MSFLAELQRRNVIRMAGLYIVGAWLVVQVAETLLPIFDTPGWVLKTLVVLLAIGLVPALVFSWVFELTPEGLKREREIDRSRSVVDHTARKLDVAVIVLLLGIGALLVWRPGGSPDVRPAVGSGQQGEPTASTQTNADPGLDRIADKSIAVLPFADFSQGGDQGWFADGLTEEILNALARTPDLLVSARTSTLKYKGSTLDVPQIAAELGVAHILEGSVRSGADRIRVTAQLIRAADGFHLWSQTYDRDPADVISIQEDLARKIATAMQTSMDPAALADMAQVGTRSVEAYQAYLRGVSQAPSADARSFRAAYEQFERARTLDPTFAAAHARAANYWLTQLVPTLTTSAPVDLTPEAMREHFRERIDLAIQHAGRDVDRHASRALKAQHDLRLREAIELQHRMLAERPNDREALGALLDLLTRTSERASMQELLDQVWSRAFEREEWANLHLNYAHRGTDRARAADQAMELAERWRDSEGNLYQAHRALLWDGRVEDARKVFERWRQLASQGLWSSIPPARQASAEGRCEEVAQMLAALPPGDISQRWHILMLLDRRDEANQLLMPFEHSGNTQALAGFLSYRHFDPSPFPSLMRVLERERIQRPPPEPLPLACKPAGAAS
jgi:TolB-like protein